MNACKYVKESVTNGDLRRASVVFNCAHHQNLKEPEPSLLSLIRQTMAKTHSTTFLHESGKRR